MTKTTKALRAVFLIAVVVSCLKLAGAAGPVQDISGTWSFSIDMGNAQGEPTFVFKQQGDTLTGTFMNSRGQAKVTGTVKGNTAVFGWEAKLSIGRPGETTKATYRGTIESATKMKGTVEFTGGVTGTGTWVGVKK